MLLPEHPAIYAFTRAFGGRALLVVANLSDEPVACDLSGDALVLTNLPEETGSTVLVPWEARVYRSADD
jgi:oligo-1,6-glucosidase